MKVEVEGETGQIKLVEGISVFGTGDKSSPREALVP